MKFNLRGQGGVVTAIGFVICFGLLYYAFLQIWAPIQNDLLLPFIDDSNNAVENDAAIKLIFLAMPFFLAVVATIAVFLIAGQRTPSPAAEF